MREGLLELPVGGWRRLKFYKVLSIVTNLNTLRHQDGESRCRLCPPDRGRQAQIRSSSRLGGFACTMLRRGEPVKSTPSP